MGKSSSTAKKVVKVATVTFGSIILVLLMAILLILFVPAVQTFIAHRTAHYFSKKTHTEIRISSLGIESLRKIKLNGVFIADQNHDTLLYCSALSADIRLKSLLTPPLYIDNLQVDTLTSKIYNTPKDSIFNYQFITNIFASNKKKEKLSPSSSSFGLKAHAIKLHKIRFIFGDVYHGNRYCIDLNHLLLTNGEIALKDNQYKLGSLAMKQLEYDSKMGEDTLRCSVNRLNLTKSRIGINAHKINIGLVDLNSMQLIYAGRAQQRPSTKEKATPKESTPWSFVAEGIKVSNSGLRYENYLTKRKKRGFDPNHIVVEGIFFNSDSLIYTPSYWSALVNQLTMAERSGLKIKELKTSIKFKDKRLEIAKFRMQTNNTILKTKAVFNNFDPSNLGKSGKHIALDAHVDTLKVGYSDLFTINPSLARSIPHELSGKSMLINSHIRGTLGRLKIDHLRGFTGNSTSVGISATITGLPDINRLRFDACEISLTSTSNDIALFGQKLTFLDSLTLPNNLHLSLKGSGSASSFNGNMLLNTSDGDLSIDANINDFNSSPKASYHTSFEGKEINLGKILRKDSTMRYVAINGTIQGTGLTLNDADASFSINIPYVDLLRYRYSNISLSGTIDRKKIHYKAEIQDTNLTAKLFGNALINGMGSTVDSKLNINPIHLMPLGFTQTPMSMTSSINIKFDNFDIDSLNFKIDTDSLIVVSEGNPTRINNFFFRSISKPEERTIQCRNNLFDIMLTGRYKLSEIPQSIGYILSEYFPHIISKPTDSLVAQKFYLLAVTLQPEQFKRIFPSIRNFDHMYLRADFNSADKSIKILSEIPRITIGDIDFVGGNLSSNLKEGNGNITLTAKRFATPAMSIFAPNITFTKKDDEIRFSTTTKDSLEIATLYNLESKISIESNKISSSIQPTCILNGNEWSITPNNLLEFSSAGIYIKDFALSSEKQKLGIETMGTKAGEPLRFDFSNFRIKSITNIVGLDTNFFRGRINGYFTLESLSPSIRINSDLNIQSLTYRRNALGNLALRAKNASEKEIAANLTLVGNGNDIGISGIYQLEKPNKINGQVTIGSFNTKLLEPLSDGFLTKTSGSIFGNASITGTLSNPHVNGEFNMEDAAIMIATTNSYLKFKKEKILFTNQGIALNNFTLLDSSNNKFTVNGSIFTKDYNDFRFDLALTSRGFEILRKKENEKSIAYGPVWINSDAKITGNTELPRITAAVNILPYSKLNIILPEDSGGANSNAGIIEFSDSLSINKPVMLTFNNEDTAKKSTLKSIDMNANISIDKEAELALKLSPTSGDMLNVKGDAKINATIDPSGKFSLTGKYQIQQGTYDLNFGGMMDRKFEIAEGSSITWRGAPTDADVNITASYKVKAAPIDLMADRVQDMDATQLNAYKEKQDFIVNLMLKGDMMKPDISFSIDMPEESRNVLDGNVYSLIQELNQTETGQKTQVASLLILGRFVASSPFSSLAGGSTQSAIRESASRILSDQINALASNLVHGVDLNFNLESREIFDSGESKNQTNLNVGVSKKIGNRVSVYVGSNFALENANPNEQKNNIAGDVAVEYKLTRDGRYRIKFFRKNKYDLVVAGEVVETGLTFSLVVDYNKFKEIFKKQRKENL